MASRIDYADHFWGEKHHGYHVLYENLKHEEESVQELAHFLKERTNFEEECNKFYSKCISKTTALSSSGGIFSTAWLVTKETAELLAEIQSALLTSIQQLLKDVVKYHEDLVRSRKRIKEQDVVDAVNIMQTTTTCLQKAKETYSHRVNELERLKKEHGTSKELLKAESKVAKSRDEYRGYVEKYEVVRQDFEEKMLRATRLFQAHDQSYLQQLKQFMCNFACAVDDSVAAASQVCTQYRISVSNVNIEEIMVQFLRAKGTGSEKPEIAIFEEIEPAVENLLSLPSSSSNSSIAINSSVPQRGIATNTTDLLSLQTKSLDTWTDNNTLKATQSSPVASDSSSSTAANTAAVTASTPFSTSLGRQKLSLWLPGKRKKYSSQSSLSQSDVFHPEFSHNQSESLGFLKKYRTKHKKSNLDLATAVADSTLCEDTKSNASSNRSEDKTVGRFVFPEAPIFATNNGSLRGAVSSLAFSSSSTALPPPPPSIPPPSDSEDEGEFQDQRSPNVNESRWSSCTESSEDDEELKKAAKLRQINIRPLNESNSNMNASVDELRDAIGNIILASSMNRSSTFDGDPWTTTMRTTPFSASFGGSVRPLRAALTGDDYLRKKNNNSYNSSLPFSVSSSGVNIARARPHSSTPTPGNSYSGLQGIGYSSCSLSARKESVESDSESITSLERCTPSDLPFAMSTSNLFSVSATIAESRIPVAMAVNEYIHAWFKGSDITKAKIRVFGTILISFPAAVIPILADLSNGVDSLKFIVTNAEKIKTIQPNNELIASVDDAFAAPYTFAFNKVSLAKWFIARKAEKPDSHFFNTEVIRYELKEPEPPPLIMNAYWKLEVKNTDLRIDYRLNTKSSIKSTLLNIVFTTKVNGSVANVIADPKAEWSPLNETISWRLTELSRHGECGGSLKARLSLSNGPTIAAQTHVQFQTSDATVSGTNVILAGDDSYDLSMVRRRVISGKYFCDAETR